MLGTGLQRVVHDDCTGPPSRAGCGLGGSRGQRERVRPPRAGDQRKRGRAPGLLALQRCLEDLRWPYTIFGPDTPITMVAQYAGQLCTYLRSQTADRKGL